MKCGIVARCISLRMRRIVEQDFMENCDYEKTGHEEVKGLSSGEKL